jgi:hypothetical protein
MIVKLQLPLSDPDAPCLIYDKARTVFVQAPVTDEIRRAMGDNMKAYFKANYNKPSGNVELIERAPPQEW